MFVVRAPNRPRCHRVVRARQHFIASRTVLLPILARLVVDRAGFPLLEGIGVAVLQAVFLLGFANVEVVLN